MTKTSGNLLDEYNAKRDFSKTREPKGILPKTKSKQPVFVVQRHEATRLHWDLRLEMDGVLKSWAVTNEPVPDPSVKRLAVRTEDHPLAYAQFSGDIPAGEYGGGHMDIWDQGVWEAVGDAAQGLEKGKLGFVLQGEKLQGQWTLVKMRGGGKRENWLLIKSKEDGVAPEIKIEKAKKSSIPKPALKAPRTRAAIAFDPVLALRVDEPPEGKDWLHEIKYDGYRALLHLDQGKATIITRNGLDWTERFGEIAEAAGSIKAKSAALDGEIVVYEKSSGVTDFSLLQQTLSGETSLRMDFIAFDLLELDGKDLKSLPLIERKEQLQKLLQPKALKGKIDFSDHVIGDGKKFFKEAVKMGVEGIISKRASSAYRAGRNGEWLKIKIEQIEEFVIGGLLRRSDNKARVGAVLLGQFKDGKFVYVGKSGTGFPEKISDDLMQRAKNLRIDKSPFTGGTKPPNRDAEWLKPELVCMIHYTEMTADGHIRHGVFKGLREDKPAADVKPERIKAMADALKETKTKKAKPKEAKEKVQTLSSGDPVFSGVTVSHPERIVYPENNYSKKDVVAYYDAIADIMLPFIENRPVSIIRCPDGLSSKCFFQRHVTGKTTQSITLLPIKDETSGEPYFAIDTKKALVAMVQFGAIEFHPWGSIGPKYTKANRIIFDLDPDPKIDLPSIKAAVLLVRDRLEALGLKSFLKTTGGKGLHVVAPIAPEHDWDAVKAFAKKFAEDLERDYPTAFVSDALKAKRKGKIFLDYLRNDYTATAVAPYSLRARVGAPVSVPLAWDELKALKATDFYTMENILKRVTAKNFKDPWAEMPGMNQKLSL